MDHILGLSFGSIDTISNSGGSLIFVFGHCILIKESKCSNSHWALTLREIGKPFFINKKTVSASRTVLSYIKKSYINRNNNYNKFLDIIILQYHDFIDILNYMSKKYSMS